MKNIKCIYATIAFLLLGCAHTHELENPNQIGDAKTGVQMEIGSREVSEGQRVDVFLISCHRLPARKDASKTSCHNNKVGEAVVQKIIDENSSIIVPMNGLVINNTMRVERKKE